MKKNLLLLSIALILLACNSENKPVIVETKPTAAFDMSQAKTFIDSINTKWVEQIKNGDSTTLASHYSSDAELLMEKTDVIKGKGILSAWGEVCRSQARDWTFTTTDLQGDGNFLIETGIYDVRDASKKPVDKGKYVVVWKKQADGSWKLYRDIGASSPMSK